LARASKVKQRPSFYSIETLDVSMNIFGPTRTQAPPASAMSQVPAVKLSQASAIATSELEQAVSMDRLGPRRSSR
jgi:hypothetical protein